MSIKFKINGKIQAFKNHQEAVNFKIANMSAIMEPVKTESDKLVSEIEFRRTLSEIQILDLNNGRRKIHFSQQLEDEVGNGWYLKQASEDENHSSTSQLEARRMSEIKHTLKIVFELDKKSLFDSLTLLAPELSANQEEVYKLISQITFISK